MTIKRLFGIIILVCVMAGACLAADPADSYGPGDYQALLAKAKAMDKTLDFKALRLSYTKSPQYAPYSDVSCKKARKLMDEFKFEEAIPAANAVLETNFTDPGAHQILYTSYLNTGKEKEAAFHRWMWDGLIKSITDRGNGESIETAYLVTSVHEEYDLMRDLVLKPLAQKLIKKGDRYYDEISVIEDPKSGEKALVYFDCTIPYKTLLK